MLVDGEARRADPDPSLLRLLARTHDIQSRLALNTDLSVHDVATEEQNSAAYIYTLLRLAWLAPDITTAILNGHQPPQLNAAKLMGQVSRLPANWASSALILASDRRE